MSERLSGTLGKVVHGSVSNRAQLTGGFSTLGLRSPAMTPKPAPVLAGYLQSRGDVRIAVRPHCRKNPSNAGPIRES